MSLGEACGRHARTLCYDCGTSLCSAHAERCELCAETFCQSCLSFHQQEHSKAAHADRQATRNKKSA
jgi:predicted sulfurtransferase